MLSPFAGLVALMLLHDARRSARLGPHGNAVALGDQDRTRWDAARIAEGTARLDRALVLPRGCVLACGHAVCT